MTDDQRGKTAPTSQGSLGLTGASAGRNYPWLSAIRRQAAARFAEMGFPDNHGMKHGATPTSPPLPRPHSSRRGRAANGVTAGMLGNFVFGDTDCCNLVFVNGFYSANLSTPGALPKGVRAGSLAAALQSEPKKIEPYLARHADFQDECIRCPEYGVHAGWRLHLPAA